MRIDIELQIDSALCLMLNLLFHSVSNQCLKAHRGLLDHTSVGNLPGVSAELLGSAALSGSPFGLTLVIGSW